MAEASDPLAAYAFEYLEQVVDTRTLAHELGVSTDTLYDLGKAGRGPPRFRVSPRRYGYRRRDVLLHQLRQQETQKETASAA